MDVQKWLENTADRAAPVGNDRHTPPDFIRPQIHASKHLGRTYHRKKTCTMSDSSINELRPSQRNYLTRNEALAGRDSHSICGGDSTADISDQLQSERSHSSARREVNGKAYERRARYKTKPDRYEHKSKKCRLEEKTKDPHKSKLKRRKTNHRNDGGRTNSLVQSFQLKNGTKKSRLTLKPQAAAGMFSHGRASAQIPGRGTGLPDLVFNEMKFLQRPKEHQDEYNLNEQSNSKKTRNQLHEEEISTYFAAPKTVTSIDAGRFNAKRRRTTGNTTIGDKRQQDGDNHLRATSVGQKPSNWSASLPLSNAPKADESCYTWAESIPRQSESDIVCQLPVPVSTQLKAPASSRRKTHLTFDQQFNCALPSRNADTSTGQRNKDISHRSYKNNGSGPFKVSCSPLNPPKLETRGVRSMTQSASQSLPKRSSSAHDQLQLLRNDYHTSDILNLYPLSQGPNVEEQLSFPEKENRDAEEAPASTPTSKLLRDALDAVLCPHENNTRDISHEHYAPEDFVDLANFELSRMLDAHRRAGHQLSHRKSKSDAQHTFDKRSTSQDHAIAPTQLAQRGLTRGITVCDAPCSQFSLWRCSLYDTFPRNYEGAYYDEEAMENNQNRHDGQREDFYQVKTDYDVNEAEFEHDYTCTYDANSLEIIKHVPRGVSVGDGFESDHDGMDEAKVQPKNELSGFWRPHILY